MLICCVRTHGRCRPSLVHRWSYRRDVTGRLSAYRSSCPPPGAWRSWPCWTRRPISVGETGCQRTVSPFSRSSTRHWSGSRSSGSQGQGAAPAGGLGVQPQQQRVQLRVITGSRGDLVDLRQPVLRHGPAGGWQAPRLGHLPGRVIGLADQPVLDGPLDCKHAVSACLGLGIGTGPAQADGIAATAGSSPGWSVAGVTENTSAQRPRGISCASAANHIRSAGSHRIRLTCRRTPHSRAGAPAAQHPWSGPSGTPGQRSRAPGESACKRS